MLLFSDDQIMSQCILLLQMYSLLIFILKRSIADIAVGIILYLLKGHVKLGDDIGWWLVVHRNKF